MDEELLPGLTLPPGPMRREGDSLDDFEHLGEPPRDKINTGAPDELPDPLQPPNKMDTNLLDLDGFPDRSAADDKLDHFLQEMNQFSSSKDFIEAERKPANHDSVERYSDSEDEDFKPSKYGDVPKAQELPESEPEKFQDFHEFEPVKVVKPQEPAPPPPVPKEEPRQFVEEVKEPPKPKEEVKEVKKVEEKAKAGRTDAEAIFCKMGLDTWFNPEKLNPKVESLIYWRDPKKSGPVFGGVLVVLLALTYFSLISVVAYLSLTVLGATIAFRVYKSIVQAVQKTGEGHPFKEYLEWHFQLPEDKVKEIAEVAVAHFNATVVVLRRLFLVEDLVDSIKFALGLWALTYLGAWFNGMTLIILAWVALFSLPKVYETNKTQIDANFEIVRTKVAEITSKVKAAIPIGKKPEEKKEQ